MNTPRSKVSSRANKREPIDDPLRRPMGQYSGGIGPPVMAQMVGLIIAYIPHIEEFMIGFMAILMGRRDAPARQVFKSLMSEEARIKTLRAMLEQSPLNNERGPEFDEIISLFDQARTRRNAYAHGLWETHESGRCFLRESTIDELSSLYCREVTPGELKNTISLMDDLFDKLKRILITDYEMPPQASRGISFQLKSSSRLGRPRNHGNTSPQSPPLSSQTKAMKAQKPSAKQRRQRALSQIARKKK